MANITIGQLWDRATNKTAGGIAGAVVGRVRDGFFHFSMNGYSGLYKIAGTCTIDGVAYANKRVTADPSHNPVLTAAATFSAVDGSFTLDGLAAGTYHITGHDDANAKNSVIKAYVQAVAR